MKVLEKVRALPDVPVDVAPVTVTPLILLLSEALTLYVTVLVGDEVDNWKLLSLVVKLLITGAWSSALVIVIVILSVELLPAASDTVNVTTSVLDPKL